MPNKNRQKSFLWGNIAPDFDFKLTKKPHYSSFYLNPVHNAIQNLLSINEQSAIKADVDFSYCLGVICHFYADFFVVHIRLILQKNIITHVRYERLLCKSFKDNYGQLLNINFTLKSLNFYFGSSPEQFYTKLLSTANKSDDMFTELSRAVMACCWVANLVADKACSTSYNLAV